MTFSTIPAVEVEQIEPELLGRLEGVLRDGESLQSFVVALKVRRIQAALLAQGEAPWKEYQRTGVARLVNDLRVFCHADWFRATTMAATPSVCPG
jgi:hypothetical protein